MHFEFRILLMIALSSLALSSTSGAQSGVGSAAGMDQGSRDAMKNAGQQRDYAQSERAEMIKSNNEAETARAQGQSEKMEAAQQASATHEMRMNASNNYADNNIKKVIDNNGGPAGSKAGSSTDAGN